MNLYALDEKNCVVEVDFFSGVNFPLRKTIDNTIINEYEVRTSFIGVNVNPNSNGPIQTFETIIMNNLQICGRYSTYKEAVAGHNKIVRDIECGRFENSSDFV